MHTYTSAGWGVGAARSACTVWNQCADLLQRPGACIYMYICIDPYMYVCTYTYTYTCVHVYIYIYIHLGTYIYIHIYKYTYRYTYMNIYVCVYAYIYIYTYICIYICIYIYIRICIVIYMYINIYTHTHIYIYVYAHFYIYTQAFTFSHLLQLPGAICQKSALQSFTYHRDMQRFKNVCPTIYAPKRALIAQCVEIVRNNSQDPVLQWFYSADLFANWLFEIFFPSALWLRENSLLQNFLRSRRFLLTLCRSLHVCVCMYIYVYICMYLCTFIYTYNLKT